MRLGNAAAAIFPKGSFRPSLGFVRTGEELDPLADAGGSRNFAVFAAAATVALDSAAPAADRPRLEARIF